MSNVTDRINAGPIQRAEIRDLQARYGVVAWFGFTTRHWWAMDDDRLVEAATPARLADAVIKARKAHAERWVR